MADKAIFGRPAGYRLEIDGDFAQSVCYTYGTDGRMDTITLTNAQGRSVSVGHDWTLGRLAGCAVRNAAGSPLFSRTQTRASRRPALVTAITNAGIQPLTSNLSSRTFSYAYDAVGRPVERGADAFAYNARGEVTNATIDSAAWSYAYDLIGNRTTSSDSAGATAYTANNVNQYTAVGADAPEYDLDGNLVVFGHCTNAWNAAGRLVSTTWAETNGLKRLRSEYDHRGRRIRRTQETSSDGGATWTAIETRTFVYDDWNLICEQIERPGEGAAELACFWGPDLSGTLQGAGGVGGLVAVSVDGDFYFPGYDNNGNVVGFWDEAGSLVAEYAYDAFGNTIASSGSMASVFPHRFSTKYYDSETSLYYYGYRYYSPSLGRWISRDLIEENGGMNLYASCDNALISGVDFMGFSNIRFLSPSDSGDKEVLSPDDVHVTPAVIHYGYGNFPDPILKTTVRSGRLCRVDVRLEIRIDSHLQEKTDHRKGETVAYIPHEIVNGNRRQTGGIFINPTYDAVHKHEKGHAKAFLEIVKPKLLAKFEPYFTNEKSKYSDELAEIKYDIAFRQILKDELGNIDYLQKSAEYANSESIHHWNPILYNFVGYGVFTVKNELRELRFVWKKK